MKHIKWLCYEIHIEPLIYTWKVEGFYSSLLAPKSLSIYKPLHQRGIKTWTLSLPLVVKMFFDQGSFLGRDLLLELVNLVVHYLQLPLHLSDLILKSKMNQNTHILEKYWKLLISVNELSTVVLIILRSYSTSSIFQIPCLFFSVRNKESHPASTHQALMFFCCCKITRMSAHWIFDKERVIAKPPLKLKHFSQLSPS